MLVKNKDAQNPGAWCGLNQPDLLPEEADAVIFGIPFDKGVSYRSGAKEGPQVLRENTYSPTPFTEHFASFSNLKVVDLGDFIYEGNRENYFREIEDQVKELVEMKIFFTMIGGDHSVTIPVQRGIDRALDGDFGIIHIDAHFDLCHELGGDTLSHGSTERRALELKNISGPENLYFVGIRSIEADEYAFKKEHEIQVKSASQCYREGMDRVAQDCIKAMATYEQVYVTLDIDCLDPAFAAGTGTPQFGGLNSRQVLDFLERIFSALPILGMDIVEISPSLDPSLTAMFAGRKIQQEVWGHLAKKWGKLEE